MDKRTARDVILAYTCCSFSNNDNNLCNVCPWSNSGKCNDMVLDEKTIVEAVHVVKEMKTMKTMKLSDIKIRDSFLHSVPSQAKIDKYVSYWNENHKQLKPIVVDHDYVLRDGYIQYLVLKDNNVEEAEIKTVKKRRRNVYRPNNKTNATYRNQMTAYIYGIHPNSGDTKERVWRVPESWTDWESNILPGDKIFVRTKFGIAPIIVTKIKWLGECPVDLPVKKVYKKFR